MKILILGGDGMLAYALKQVFTFDKLLAFGHKTCDITNPIQIDNHLGGLKPDVVINCAAFTNVEQAEHSPNMAELVNSVAVDSLATLCKKHDCKLVHFSTEMVFGQEAEEGYTEAAVPLKAVNVYGRTKREGEKKIKTAWEKHWLIRTSWMFGPGGTNFIEKILERARKNDEIDVVADQIACPTYTFDLARAVYDLVHSGSPFGTYHLTNSGHCSRAKWAWEIIDYASLECRVNHVASEDVVTNAKRPKQGVLVNTKRPQLRSWVDAMVEYLMGTGEMFSPR